VPELHPFERKGLGFAPFRFVRLTRGGGGGCAYCGKLIAWTCTVADVDGREFTVGTDCVTKTGTADVRLRNQVEREAARQKSAARRERDGARFADAFAALQADETLFADEPHPWKRERTYRDDVIFRLSYSAPKADRLRAIREVEGRAAIPLPTLEEFVASANAKFEAKRARQDAKSMGP
jgi:hypothetical protein